MKKNISGSAIVFLFCLPLSVFSQTQDSGNTELRTPHKIALMGEVGVNGLASLLGIAGSYYFRPNMAVDAGVGVSSEGLRPGIRYRYLFTQSEFAPFIGAGVKYGLGSGNREVDFKDANNSNAAYSIKVKPAGFADICTGLDYQSDNGFFMLGTLGWSFHLGSDSLWEVTKGAPVNDTQKLLNFIYGSGPTIAIAFGWAFH